MLSYIWLKVVAFSPIFSREEYPLPGEKSGHILMNTDIYLFSKQSLLPLLDGRPTLTCFNQEACTAATPRVDMRGILGTACNAPPQVDVSACRNVSWTIRKGGERTHAFLGLLRPFCAFLSTFARRISGNGWGNDGDKSKPGKKKPEKGKSNSDRQSKREQQERRKPKTRGEVPALPFQRSR